MLYVTHDQVEAMTLGHRVAVMRLGVLQQVAPPQELYTRPVNLFVASFIGSPAMNVVEAELHREPDGLRARFGPHDMRIDAGLAASRPALARLRGPPASCSACGRRTSRTRRWSTPRAPTASIEATVELRENLGPEVDVHVGIDAPMPALEAVIEATESADRQARPAWPGGPKASSSPGWAPAPRRARAIG